MSQRTRTQLSRVYVPEDAGDLYNSLTAEGARRETVNPIQVPFFKYKDVFLLCACLGYRTGQRKLLPKGDKKREIRLDTFDGDDIEILKAIAIAESADVEDLLDMGSILTMAEEYAYAGAAELELRLISAKGQPLWNLLELIAPPST